MKEFASEVFEVTRPLVDNGFRRSWPLSREASGLFAMVKRLTPLLCAYLFVRVGGQDSREAHLWVAPLELPDDSIESLGVGYKISLGQTWEGFEAFYKAVTLRTELALPCLRAIGESVTKEFHCPELETRRRKVYRLARMAYEIIHNRAKVSGDPSCRRLLKLAASIARGHDAYADLEEATTSVWHQIASGTSLVSLFTESVLPDSCDQWGLRDPVTIASLIRQTGLAAKPDVLQPSAQLYLEALVPMGAEGGSGTE